MNRDRYLTELGSYLGILPLDRKTKILEFYSEHTAKLEAEGKDLVETLGTPKELATNIIDMEMSDGKSANPTKRKKRRSFGKIIFTIIILFIIVFVGFFALLGLSGHSVYWDNEKKRFSISDSDIKNVLEKTELEDFDTIDLKARYATVCLIPSDGYYIEYSITTGQDNLYKVKNNKLTFDDSSWSFFRIGFGNNTKHDDYINIYYPEGADLNKLIADLDMGSLEIKDASLDKLDIDLDMGSLEISNSKIDDIDSDLDMGSISIDNGYFSNASFELDMGDLDISNVSVGRELSANLDMGSATVFLQQNDGGDVDYGFDLESDMGSVTLNGNKKGKSYQESGHVDIDIECDMGSIDVSY